jgi:hypothetical protein
MKKKSLFILWASIFLFSIHAFTQNQENTSDIQASNMVKNFYSGYLKAFNSSLDTHIMVKELDFLKKKYCTKDLIVKIDKQLKNDEIDYDPFIKAQDANIGDEKTLTIKKDEKKTNVFIVSYVSAYDHFKKVINTHVVKKIDGYKIDSIW